ncbi:MAG TPA: glycerol-3-phosphate dehydrogenase/oxidase [Pyrinomonadaceae bacterium]|nr:glycerol-3-phosphate dehydrogenase/oxidase [Chloracidobacterium sp.]MBP9935365.1 glycerol-3-phosphate dehydrogenase/oxidase [Pyrinomonadaceae bacterium]MBK9766842.1 glycerol-3-phosphate dehydrogenase/oxidase [Chloracidobacterium sp.]MBL0241302.1 glycerol-3-phosphate dehydrogenase/oxidase [Chloracidobacterium sp.]HQX54970.1 glycerol-3-phosphate dehydrogenase/oxidase [Pyrinomonadaceae bacterium]
MERDTITATIRDKNTPWDVIVIGGGATGVGCAVDAATRGYSVLLLEQHDFGKGTSSRSTKLVHGGVRYLRQGDIPLVREALRERGILLRNAPNVVKEQAFIVPCYSRWQKLFYGIGLKAYGILSGKYALPRSRIVSRAEALQISPTFVSKGLVGGVVYFDGRFDDTRLLVDLVKTAASHGACLLNYAIVTGITKDRSGRATGVSFIDVETGEKMTARSRSVVNATGVFTDPVRKMSDPSAVPLIKFAQGVHLVIDRRFLPAETAIMIPKTSDGRVLFCIPWQGYTLVGTTDTPIDSATLEPKALASEIDFLLETAAKYLTSAPGRADVRSVFAGVRPLISSGSDDRTSSISRSHDIFIDAAGLVTITGGKWTTYRRMAEDAIDNAAKVGGLDVQPSVTESVTIDHEERSGNGRQLHQEIDLTEDDVIRSVRSEMARTVEDVLARRSRALFLNATAAIEIAPLVAEILALELQKDDDWVKRQIDEFSTLARDYLIPLGDGLDSDAD